MLNGVYETIRGCFEHWIYTKKVTPFLFEIIVDKYIALQHYNIEVRYIAVKCKEVYMDAHIKKVYVPMTETGFYILFCLQEEMHGYNIGLKVKNMTNGELTISPGTMYGTLSKMENDKLISFVKEEDKRKFYIITELGKEVLEIELRRIERLYRNSRGE